MSTAPAPTLTSSQLKMEQLCESFPTLRGRPGTFPWDQKKFAAWVASPGPTSAEIQAGLFVLSVWNGGNHKPWWKRGRFDAVHAIGVWDYEHINAFMNWCAKPFWP